MRTIAECVEDIKSILNNVERTQEYTGETSVDINELVDEILSINAVHEKQSTCLIETNDKIFMLEKHWRYSINDGKAGGIVIADTKKEAEEKVRIKYHKNEFCVWQFTNDEYFDNSNTDVFECYGY